MEEIMDNTSPARVGDLREPFIEMAVDSWRFSKTFSRVLEKLDPTDAARYTNQLRYFQRRLDDNLALTGIRIVSLEGQPYDAGMAASALNMEDFSADDLLMVEQMVEPLLMGPDGVVKPGTILLKRVN
jgi:hypothetical protein